MAVTINDLFAVLVRLGFTNLFDRSAAFLLDLLALYIRIVLLCLVPFVADDVVVVALDHVLDRLGNGFIRLQPGAWRPEVDADALATPRRLDEQHRLVVVVAHHMAELQLQPDASGGAVTDRQVAPALEVVDPHVLALDVLTVLVEMGKKISGLRCLDLVIK